MKMLFNTIRSSAVLLGCLVGLGQTVMAEDNVVVVKPQPTDELLANPGMGWETFHGLTSKTDKTLPRWIPSTVMYIRWGWIDLEPHTGQLNTNLIDQTLKEANVNGG